MLIVAYDYINKVPQHYIQRIIQLFNHTAKEVCEGQQLDMDFETVGTISLHEYLHMIELKTSVLLAASLKMGAILGGAGEGNQRHISEFGRNLGLAFQIQDDYLDAFGDPTKVGKQAGGDILANKKTYLLCRSMEMASHKQQREIEELMHSNSPDKVAGMISMYKSCGVDKEAKKQMDDYLQKSMKHLDDIAVLSNRKEPLRQLARFLIQRDY
jgi:geranylgeranyl diphosphate synthase type II